MSWWKKISLTLVVLLVLGYVLFMGTYFATSEPSFCGRCHEVKPYYDSWQKSVHKGVKCLFCHEPRGFVGKVHSKSRGVNYLYQHFTHQYTIVTQAPIFEQNCIGCHLGDYKNFPDAQKLNQQHYEYLKENKHCVTCHRAIGHEVNIFSKEKFK